MYQIFLKVLDMSMAASVVILAVLLARLLFKKAPRAVSCALWIVVLFRLLCPWSPESYRIGVSAPISLSSVSVPVEDASSAGFSGTAALAAEAGTSEALASRPIGWQQICGPLWILGMAALIIYSLISLLRLRKRLVGAVRLRDNLFVADHLETAFVLGLLRPRIYLPSSLPDREQTCILAHERAHIRRGDPWFKALGFLALTVHWFNPLVWLAFVLACRDMEMACDEAVVRKLGPEIGGDYAASLLGLTTGRRILAGTPLAFGEGDTGGRVRHILGYKRPAFWVVLGSAAAVLMLAVILIFQRTAPVRLWNARYTVKDILYDAPQFNFTYSVSTAPEYAILPDGSLYVADTGGRELVYSNGWTYAGTLVPVEMDRKTRNALFDPSTNSVQKIMNDVTAVYEAQWQVSGPEQTRFHYLMITRQGKQYLSAGHNRERVRWLFELECQGSSGDMGYLDLVISKQLGRDVTCFSLFESDALPNTQLAGWTSAGQTGFTELFFEESGGGRSYTDTGRSGWADWQAAQIYVFLLAPRRGEEALVVLNCNDALAEIRYSYEGKAYRTTFSGIHEIAVLDWPDVLAQSGNLLFLDRQGSAISVPLSLQQTR